MKVPSVILLLPAFFVASCVFAQDCVVEKESLKGSYTGDCKKGKANGKGKAVGTDTYEGEFKSGLPEGQGAYTWSNGNRYTGKFAKGLREGKGVMIFKRINAADSLIQGFWKNDVYAGKYEKPYIVYFTSKAITQVETEYKKQPFSQVSFFVTNTSSGGIELRGENEKMKVDEINMIRGNYGRMTLDNNHVKRSETVLHDVTFPARMKVKIGGEELEMEFLEEGVYVVNIRINE